MHPIFLYAMTHLGSDVDATLGAFARKYAIALPAEGSLPELRGALVMHMQAEGANPAHISWEATVLEVLWDKVYPPCAYQGCSALAMPNGTLCKGHTLASLL